MLDTEFFLEPLFRAFWLLLSNPGVLLAAILWLRPDVRLETWLGLQLVLGTTSPREAVLLLSIGGVLV
jgi:hypothetical protein